MTGIDENGRRFVVTRVTPGDEPSVELAGEAVGGWFLSELVPPPDLSHPGTRAFLLEDVRKAWGRPDIALTGNPPSFKDESWGWNGVDVPHAIWGAHPTEAEALLAALQAAPEAASA